MNDTCGLNGLQKKQRSLALDCHRGARASLVERRRRGDDAAVAHPREWKEESLARRRVGGGICVGQSSR